MTPNMTANITVAASADPDAGEGSTARRARARSEEFGVEVASCRRRTALSRAAEERARAAGRDGCSRARARAVAPRRPRERCSVPDRALPPGLRQADASISSSASSRTVRFLRLTTRRKSVKAYCVAGGRAKRETGDDDHNTCSQGSGKVSSVFIDASNLRHSKKRDKTETVQTLLQVRTDWARYRMRCCGFSNARANRCGARSAAKGWERATK